MKVDVVSLKGEIKGSKVLPPQFSELVRPDLIKRAVQAIQSHKRQAYGADPRAGVKYSADLPRRRRKYKTPYGRGVSRVPRKTLSSRGTQFYWVGAFAPGTVGGRRAHPPKAEKVVWKKINKKERKKAIRSALAATFVKDLVLKRGHRVPDSFPFILSDDAEKIGKTKEFSSVLLSLGFKDELKRSSVKKIRPGKGTMRGRPYKKAKGILLVVGNECPALKSFKNIPGADVVEVSELNAELLAPGCHPGRLTLFTESAIDKLNKEGLFL